MRAHAHSGVIVSTECFGEGHNTVVKAHPSELADRWDLIVSSAVVITCVVLIAHA